MATRNNERGQLPARRRRIQLAILKMVRLLLERGAADGAARWQTALMFAAMFDRVEIIELLLHLKADSASAIRRRMTALLIWQKR